MLVISRRIGESFVIGDDIEATIIDITGEKVVLGVSAPKSMPITRCAPDPDEAAARAAARQRGSGGRGKRTL